MSTGKSRADFPGSFIPFDKSAGLKPAVSIDASPTVQLCVNVQWLPYIITCLKALGRPETWDDTYDNAVIAASEFAALIGDIQDGCGVVVPAKMCVSGSFKDLDYGFVPTPGSECVATWIPGTGWEMCANATPQGFLDIKREFGTETIIRAFSLVINLTLPYLIDYTVTLFDNSDFVQIAHDEAVAGPTIVIDVNDLLQPATAIFIHIVETLGGAAAAAVLTDWSLCYTGAFPLSVPVDHFVHVFDFAVSDGGWTPLNGTYHDGAWFDGQSITATAHYRGVTIIHPAAGVRIIDVTVEYAFVAGTRAIDSGDTDGIYDYPSFASLYHNDYRSDPPSPMKFTGDHTVASQLFVQILAGLGDGVDPGGSVEITKITVRGFGVDPF